MTDPRTKAGTLLPTQAFVSRQFYSSGEPVGKPNQTEEVLEIHNYAVQPAAVKVEMGMTINLGNFESAKITVGLIQPCYSEERDAAYEFAKGWVEERTLKEAGEARRFAQGRSQPF